MLTPEQQTQVQTLLETADGQRPEITIGLIMRYLQTRDVAVRLESDLPNGSITIRF